MAVNALCSPEHDPSEIGSHMQVLTEDVGAKCAGNEDPDEVVHRMKVLGDHAHSRLKAVMMLVEVGIEDFPMRQLVEKMKSEVLSHQHKDDLEEKG